MENINSGGKRIAIVTYALNTGGVSTFIEDLSEIFENEGFQTDIYTTEKKGDYFYTLKNKGKFLHNIRFDLLKWIPFGRIIHSIFCGFLIRMRSYNAVFLVHSYAAHHSLFLYRNRTLVFSVIQNTERNVVKLGCRFPDLLDGIICVSRNIYDSVVLTIKDGKCFLIENSIHLPSDEKYSCMRKPLDNKAKVLYLGRLDNWQKGVLKIPDILQELLNISCEIDMTIVGSGNDKEELMKRIYEIGLQKSVHFMDAVPRNKVDDLFAEHHVFLMPSNFEGLPFTLMEAMSWGCVPVASELKGVTDYCVDPGINGFLIPPDDIKGFAGAISKIILSREKWSRMSRASREKALSNFSIDKMKGKYINLINRSNKKKIHHIGILSIFRMYSLKEIFPYQVIIFTKRMMRKIKVGKII